MAGDQVIELVEDDAEVCLTAQHVAVMFTDDGWVSSQILGFIMSQFCHREASAYISAGLAAFHVLARIEQSTQ